MKNALELACQGHGQIVAAMGEPGVGKSRLFFEFKAMAQSGCLVLEAYSVSHGKASAYLPVIDLLKSYFRISAEDDERVRREKIAGKIVILDRALEDTLPYLYSLLGISEEDNFLGQFDPQTRRQRTLQAVKRILTRESLNQPLIVIFEDLHWIDSETQALLNLLVDAIATVHILLMVNYRPEYHHNWGSKTYYTQLRLDPLGKDRAAQMLTTLIGDSERIAPARRVIVERSEGNPFFMEEIVQALFEQGVLVRNGAVELAKSLDQITLPPTVQAILASRIDRLQAPEKELLQILAVLGREFSSSLIKHVAGKRDDDLESTLSALQLAEFIYERPAFPEIEYTFKHALTQEVAYNSVLIERRRLFHERAARAIEGLFADRLEDHLAELARHYDRAGNAAKAVEYLQHAARKAAQQVAHSEAISYLTRALELLGELPGGVDRDRQELNLQMALNFSLFVARGPGTPQRELVLLRAKELSEQLADSASLLEVLLALATYWVVHRDFPRAEQFSQKVLTLAKEANLPKMMGGAHCQLGTIAFMSGKWEEAREHCDQAVKLFGPPPFRDSRDFEYASRAAGVVAGSSLMLGYPATAVEKAAESLAAVRQSSDPFQLAYALFMTFMVHFTLRDLQTVMQRGEELFSITTEHGIRAYLMHAMFFRGWAMAASGRTEEGLAEMRRASADTKASATYTFPPMLVGLAEICAESGHLQEGLDWVAEGVRFQEQTGERGLEDEFHRLKGILLLKQGFEEQAQASLRAAIDVARSRSGKFLELRATISLARLLQRQGKIDEARAMLAEIYGWFTEGFDTAELKDAKMLLDELAH